MYFISFLYFCFYAKAETVLISSRRCRLISIKAPPSFQRTTLLFFLSSVLLIFPLPFPFFITAPSNNPDEYKEVETGTLTSGEDDWTIVNQITSRADCRGSHKAPRWVGSFWGTRCKADRHSNELTGLVSGRENVPWKICVHVC